MSRSFASRAGRNARISAALDQATNADTLHRAIEAARWTVHRHVHSEGVTVTLTHAIRPTRVYGGPTAHDALRLAYDDVLGADSEGGDTE